MSDQDTKDQIIDETIMRLFDSQNLEGDAVVIVMTKRSLVIHTSEDDAIANPHAYRAVQTLFKAGFITPDVDEDTKLYRPSNGTEGDIFYENFCALCQKDQAFKQDPEHGDGCEIYARTLALDVNEPGYPKEWVWQTGAPICTAFEQI